MQNRCLCFSCVTVTVDVFIFAFCSFPFAVVAAKPDIVIAAILLLPRPLSRPTFASSFCTWPPFQHLFYITPEPSMSTGETAREETRSTMERTKVLRNSHHDARTSIRGTLMGHLHYTWISLRAVMADPQALPLVVQHPSCTTRTEDLPLEPQQGGEGNGGRDAQP